MLKVDTLQIWIELNEFITQNVNSEKIYGNPIVITGIAAVLLKFINRNITQYSDVVTLFSEC